MIPATIIREAQADGVRLALSPSGTIKATGDGAAVSRWLGAIREHKGAIIALLRAPANDKAASQVPLPPGIDPEDFEERAAIAEFDAGMPREEAEAFALADLADDRILCTACMNRRPYDGVCKAAMVDFPASRGYVPDPVLPRRCEGFKPKPGDLDQRNGRERWPGLAEAVPAGCEPLSMR